MSTYILLCLCLHPIPPTTPNPSKPLPSPLLPPFPSSALLAHKANLQGLINDWDRARKVTTLGLKQAGCSHTLCPLVLVLWSVALGPCSLLLVLLGPWSLLLAPRGSWPLVLAPCSLWFLALGPCSLLLVRDSALCSAVWTLSVPCSTRLNTRDEHPHP